MIKISNHIPRKVGSTVQARIDALKVGQKMQDLPEELWHKSFRYYVKEDPNREGGPNLRIIRLDPNKPSLTVTGYIFNKFVHPTENRFITPREAARLQGFPDKHEFIGSLSSVQLQVGNAVPVQLAKAAVKSVLDHLIKFKPMGLSNVFYKNHAFPALSLFSGAGGLDLGLEEASVENTHFISKCAVEFDEDCCKTLRHNFGKRLYVVHADITQIPPNMLLPKLCLKKNVLPLIIGGPPCQAFSQAGKQEATKDPRGNLIFEFLRFVEELKPVYFIMENVFGLRGVEKGSLMRNIIEQMDKLGYNINYKLLHAAHFGAAQLRRRFFFIGVQKPYPPVQMPMPTHEEESGLFGIKPYITVGEAFKGLPTLTSSIINRTNIHQNKRKVLYTKRVVSKVIKKKHVGGN